MGHSRATRAVRHLTLGAIIAAERFAREVGAEPLKLSAENIADRTNIQARYLTVEAEVEERKAPPSRRPVAVRAPAASLSAEIERILRTSAPPRPTEEESQPPESMTLRVASAVDVRGPASKR
jgi:hypothetical protein